MLYYYVGRAKKMDFFCILYKRIINRYKIYNITFIFLLAINIIFSIFPQGLRAQSIDTIISQVSSEYNISGELIYRIIGAESSFNSKALSRANARGLMQLTKPTWDWICQSYLNVEWDFNEYAFEPGKNIRVGTRFLKWICDYLDGHKDELNDSKEDLILACYNAGPGAVRNCGYRVPLFEETQQYVKKINKSFKLAGVPGRQ